MHEDYKRTLINEEQMRHKMRTIRSVKHKFQSFKINKISLSCFNAMVSNSFPGQFLFNM